MDKMYALYAEIRRTHAIRHQICIFSYIYQSPMMVYIEILCHTFLWYQITTRLTKHTTYIRHWTIFFFAFKKYILHNNFLLDFFFFFISFCVNLLAKWKNKPESNKEKLSFVSLRWTFFFFFARWSDGIYVICLKHECIV